MTIKANIEKMLVQPPPLPPLAVEPMITDEQPQFSKESELESDSEEVIYNVKVILKEIEGEKQEERMFCGENFEKEVEVVEEGESEEEMGERSEELENNIAGDATLSQDYKDIEMEALHNIHAPGSPASDSEMQLTISTEDGLNQNFLFIVKLFLSSGKYFFSFGI